MSLYTFISNKDRMNSFITVNKFLVTSAVLAISFCTTFRSNFNDHECICYNQYS